MSERLEAFTVRKYVTGDGEEKSAWTRIGIAFPHKAGGGWSVSLDAIPAPSIKDGHAKYEIVLRPPMERDGAKPGKSRAEPGPDSDEAPF